MIDGSEKRNRQLAFELQNSHVCEKRNKLNPSTTTVYARSAFYPSLRFTLSLHFSPGPLSAVRSLRFTLTEKIMYANIYRNTINDGDSQTSPVRDPK